jgi:hypothetical protein
MRFCCYPRTFFNLRMIPLRSPDLFVGVAFVRPCLVVSITLMRLCYFHAISFLLRDLFVGVAFMRCCLVVNVAFVWLCYFRGIYLLASPSCVLWTSPLLKVSRAPSVLVPFESPLVLQGCLFFHRRSLWEPLSVLGVSLFWQRSLWKPLSALWVPLFLSEVFVKTA